MAVVGNPTGKNDSILRGYEQDSMHGIASQFAQIAKAGLSEQVDLYSEPRKFFMSDTLNNEMRSFFVENAFDKQDPKFSSIDAVNEEYGMLNALYQNDVKGICEAAPLGAYNPVVGITFPMHKNLLMTTVFDKGAIPKDVADTPQFTLSMETRTMYSPDGREIDMFLEQNKIKDVIERAVPHKDVVIMLPEDQETDVLALLGATNKTVANVSRSSKVTKLLVKDVYVAKGEEKYDATTKEIVVETAGAVGTKVITVEPVKFVAAYGQYDRTFQKRIDLIVPTDNAGGTRKEIFQFAGSMHKNRFTFMASSANVVGVVLSAALDVSSAAYETPKVKWSSRTDYFEIPEAPHMTVTISPEETKDIQAMYNVNQLTKIMSMIKLSILNYKDDKILENLDESFLNLPATSKVTGAFNFVPPDNFLGSHVTWRYETFMDYLDTQITTMLQVLNDENMTVSIFGRPELIRKITPKEYTYTTPPSIGPVILDYKKTVKTSDNRVYQFISSNKMRNDNNLIIILNPRNTNRVIYKIFDYQLYVGNEIRDTANYQLPAVTAFERFLFVQYQPVQGRIQIVNPTGLIEDIENKTPVSKDRAMNDYTANKITYTHDAKGNGVYVDHTAELPGTPRSAMYPDGKAPGVPQDGIADQNYAYPSPNYAVTDPKN
jgi:hypothetical protein